MPVIVCVCVCVCACMYACMSVYMRTQILEGYMPIRLDAAVCGQEVSSYRPMYCQNKRV
jgi:hypothetical protein